MSSPEAGTAQESPLGHSNAPFEFSPKLLIAHNWEAPKRPLKSALALSGGRLVQTGGSCAERFRGNTLAASRRVALRKGMVAVAVAMSLAACTQAEEAALRSSAAPPIPAPSSSSSPAKVPRPPKPKNPAQAPLQGSYTVKYTLVRTNVSGADANSVGTLSFDPNCKKGPCATLVIHQSAKKAYSWTARAAYVKGRYRWTRVAHYAYSCTIAGDLTKIPANTSYSLKGTKVQLIDGQWVIARFTGEEESDGTKSGGCFPSASERYVLKGVRQ